MPLPTSITRSLAALLLAIACVALAAPELTRAGYTADEEFTAFAVRGIAASGLPLLPSGLLYDRGVLYSYAAWLSSGGGVTSLVGPRALGLAAAIGSLAAIWIGVRLLAREPAAWLAALLVATSVPFWVVASSARFYAPFLLTYTATLAVLAGMSRPTFARIFPLGRLLALVVLAALCRWTHELAFTLAAVPAASAILTRGAARARWIVATLAVTAGLVTAQAGLFALHYLAPQSGGTMIRRFFLWQVLNLFEHPPLGTILGIVPLAALTILLIAPDRVSAVTTRGRVRVWLPAAAAALGGLAILSPAHLFDYPLDLFRHVGRTMPVLTTSVVALIVARAMALGGAWTAGERAVHLLWLGWAAFFGVIDSGMTINYLLAPVTLMLAGLAIDLAAVVREQRRTPLALGAAAVIVFAWLGTTWGTAPRSALAEARPTIVAPDGPALREAAARAPMVACTDELACLLLVNRVDRWLALDDFLRQRFVVSSASGDVGVYAGTPAVTSLSSLFDGGEASRVLVVDVFKELPVGSSAAFLPRALAAEHLDATAIVETPQLRAVELRLKPAEGGGALSR